jgi:SAM-dependent methyltransferase
MSEGFTCGACGGGNGRLVLDLGMQPLANNLLTPEDLDQPEPQFPLRLFVCRDCWLLQLVDRVPPVTLFTEYPYYSSVSDTFRRHVTAAAERHRTELGLNGDSLVLEIASNDGCFLAAFQEAGIPVLGIEPAANVARAAQAQGIETLVEFFGLEPGRRLARQGRRADLVLGNNVLAHAPELVGFVSGLREVLRPGGRIVLEFPYAIDFLERAEFDTIYHEHVYYLALNPLVGLFRRQGLCVTRAERLPIHGGSVRIWAGHEGEVEEGNSVAALLRLETERGLLDEPVYERFAARAAALKSELVAQLRDFKRQGKSLAAYGASAKGSTLLNYAGIGSETLDFVADRSVYKQGRLTPGTHLPVVGADQLVARAPDYTLLLTWNFAGEILEQQAEYRRRGGKFILPVPEVRIV